MREQMNPHEVKTVKCAVCKKLKQEVNHWYLVTFDPCFFICRPFKPEEIKDSCRPVCGQGCAQKQFESWMTLVRVSEPKHSAVVQEREVKVR